MKRLLAVALALVALLASELAVAQIPISSDPVSWRVYFPLNGASLSSQGNEVIASAADWIVNGRVKAVVVIGHADTSEGDGETLSEKRAKATAEALITHGIDRKLISVEWKGKADLPIPTPDNTQEQLNRLADIRMRY